MKVFIIPSNNIKSPSPFSFLMPLRFYFLSYAGRFIIFVSSLHVEFPRSPDMAAQTKKANPSSNITVQYTLILLTTCPSILFLLDVILVHPSPFVIFITTTYVSIPYHLC